MSLYFKTDNAEELRIRVYITLDYHLFAQPPSPTVASYIVGSMRPDEADEVSKLFSRILEELPYYNREAKAGELGKYSAEALTVLMATDPCSVLVARFASDLVGFCISRDDDATTWLSWFCVHPTYRRKGVGAALLTALEQKSVEARRHKIWCDSRTDNEASKSVLSRHGFLPLCTIRRHWYQQDFVLWEKLVS